MYGKALLVLVASSLVLGICMTGIEVHAQGIMKITGRGNFGCINREYYEKMVSYLSNRDKDAFRDAYQSGLRAQIVTTFKEGEEVFLTYSCNLENAVPGI